MKFPNKNYLAQLRKQYPIGTKIQLISMRDEKYPILPGTIGEVTHGFHTHEMAKRLFSCPDSRSGFFQGFGNRKIRQNLFHRTVFYHRKSSKARLYITQLFGGYTVCFSVNLAA